MSIRQHFLPTTKYKNRSKPDQGQNWSQR